jgi:hypothetical protein
MMKGRISGEESVDRVYNSFRDRFSWKSKSFLEMLALKDFKHPLVIASMCLWKTIIFRRPILEMQLKSPKLAEEQSILTVVRIVQRQAFRLLFVDLFVGLLLGNDFLSICDNSNFLWLFLSSSSSSQYLEVQLLICEWLFLR